MVRGLVLVLTALALLPACGSGPVSPTSVTTDFVTREAVFRTARGDRSLSVRIADTETERHDGLMGVEHLPADEGMAFVFDDASTATFWMKDTPIPLSIAFVGPDGRVVTIAEMTPCEADPCTTYAADAPYHRAVEANAGWFADHGVAVGDGMLLQDHG